MTIEIDVENLSSSGAHKLLASHQIREWEELMNEQELARQELEHQLIEKYGWQSLDNFHEKSELRSLLASWHDSDRVGLNVKHLYQTRSLRLSNNPKATLTELLNEDSIEIETL